MLTALSGSKTLSRGLGLDGEGGFGYKSGESFESEDCERLLRDIELFRYFLLCFFQR